MDQLKKVIEVTGKPTEEDIAAMQSKYAKTMIDSILPAGHRLAFRSMDAIMSGAPPEAIDMVKSPVLMLAGPERTRGDPR